MRLPRVPIAFPLICRLGLRSEVVPIGTGMILTGVAPGSELETGTVGGLINSMGIRNAPAVCRLSPVWFGILAFFFPERGRKAPEAEAAAAGKSNTQSPAEGSGASGLKRLKGQGI